MPPFIIYAAADLYNNKVNLKLSFPSFPNLAQLKHHIQAVFEYEVTTICPNNSPLQIFNINKIQIFDESSGGWQQVTSQSMLKPFAQLYIIQLNSNYPENQDQITPPRDPACYISHHIGTPPNPSKTIESVNNYNNNNYNNLINNNTDNINNIINNTPPTGGYRAPQSTPVSGVYNYRSGNDGINNTNNNINNINTPISNTSNIQIPSSSNIYQSRGDIMASQYNIDTSNINNNINNNNAITTIKDQHLISTPSSYLSGLATANINTNINNINNNTLSKIPHTEKVRVIFECADKARTGAIGESELSGILKDLNIAFFPNIIHSLFRQGDTNRDGKINHRDLQILLKEYPTLTDSIYYRLNDIQEWEQLQKRLSEAKGQLQESRWTRDNIINDNNDNISIQQVVKARLSDLDVHWKNGLSAEADCHRKIIESRNEAHKVASVIQSKQNEINACMAREGIAKKCMSEAKQEVQHCIQKVSASQQKRSDIGRRIQELTQLLEQAKRDAANQDSVVSECEMEVRKGEDRCLAITEDIKRISDDIRKHREAHEGLSNLHTILVHNEGDNKKELKSQQLENEKLAVAIEDANMDLDRVEGKIQKGQKDIALVEAAIADVEQRIPMAEQELAAFAKRRAVMEAKERPLLEKEIRLKEARQKLDESEGILREEALMVFDPTVRALSPQ